MQRRPSIVIPSIYIHAFIQFCLDSVKVAGSGSIVNRISEGGSHQHHGCDCY